MPDEVAAFKYQAQTYLVMASEGDTKVFILPFDLNAADGGLEERRPEPVWRP